MNKPLFTILALLCLLAGRHANAQLACDSTFNKNGYNFFSPSGPAADSRGFRMTALPNGAVFVAGTRGNDSLTVWKYTPEGILDPSFGNAGHRSVYIGVGGYQVYPLFMDLVVQRDGKVVVMATRYRLNVPDVHNTLSDIVLARFTSAGALDPGFNGTGLLFDRPDTAFQYRPFTLAIDSTGVTDKLYVASLATENSNWSCPLGFGKWCISRYTGAGSRDAGLNSKGFIQQTASYLRNAPTISPMALPRAMRVLPSGKLLVAGGYNAMDSGCFIFRMNPNGTFDATYGNAGRIYRHWALLPQVSPDLFRAHILPDESVIFSLHSDYRSGTPLKYDSSVLQAIKCDRNGLSVNTFGGIGTLRATYRNESFHDFAIDSANRPMICWNTATAATQHMHFKRFTAGGLPDAAFGLNGYMSMEPVRNDAVLSPSLVNGAVWAKNGQHLFVLENRSTQARLAHFGVLKYKWTAAKPAPTQIPIIAEGNVIIYPQPANDLLFITADTKIVSLTMVNAAGQVVMEQAVANNRRLTADVHHLPAGLYALILQDINGFALHEKVVIAH